MQLDFSNQVVLITGGARGIGLAIAEAFAECSAKVVICDYNDELLSEATQRFKSLHFDCDAFVCDITNVEQVETLFRNILNKHGQLNVLINNAGITRDNILLRMSDEQWDAVLNTNLKGVFTMTRAAAKLFLKQRYGKIINISSVVGLTGNAGQANYAASKAGVIGFSKSVAKELASRNVTVNVIAPGFIATPMTNSLPPEVQAEFLKRIPLNRAGLPQDVAGAALFLASPLADYITGQVLLVDGGMVM
jgi:3-oxoacyl-[acyl-carrier protein] reductase